MMLITVTGYFATHGAAQKPAVLSTFFFALWEDGARNCGAINYGAISSGARIFLILYHQQLAIRQVATGSLRK
jgi:hypothetical protein